MSSPGRVLHEDDPARPGNLSAEEYEATYADGGGHQLPPGLVEAIGVQLDHAAAGGGPRALLAPPSYIAAWAHGGAFEVPPNLVVVHAAECPIRGGYARSVAGWFARSPADAGPGTSAHTFADPAEVVEMVRAGTIAYHVGPAGNPLSRGEEHAGYTAYTREQWTTPDGLAMLRLSSARRAGYMVTHDIPIRWLSIEQVRQAARTRAMADGGLCTHNDIRLAFNDATHTYTTHTDPGAGYPYDLYIDMVRRAAEGEDDVTAQEMWDYQIPFPTWAKDVPHAQPAYAAGTYLADMSARVAQVLQRETAQSAAIAALRTAIAALAKLVAAPAPDLTAEQVEAAVGKAIRENSVFVDVSVHGGSAAAPDQPPVGA